MSGYELGQRVVATRQVATDPDSDGRRGTSRHYVSQALPAAVEGVVVGRRTVQDGLIRHEDGYSWYEPGGPSLSYWLVAVDLRRNPLRVPDDGVCAAPPPAGHGA